MLRIIVQFLTIFTLVTANTEAFYINHESSLSIKTPNTLFANKIHTSLIKVQPPTTQNKTEYWFDLDAPKGTYNIRISWSSLDPISLNFDPIDGNIRLKVWYDCFSSNYDIMNNENEIEIKILASSTVLFIPTDLMFMIGNIITSVGIGLFSWRRVYNLLKSI